MPTSRIVRIDEAHEVVDRSQTGRQLSEVRTAGPLAWDEVSIDLAANLGRQDVPVLTVLGLDQQNARTTRDQARNGPEDQVGQAGSHHNRRGWDTASCADRLHQVGSHRGRRGPCHPLRFLVEYVDYPWGGREPGVEHI